MINDFIEQNKLPRFRESQFDEFFYQKGIESFGGIKTWPKELKEKLSKEVEFMSLELDREFVSSANDTIKVLFKRKVDGQRIEAVLMKHSDGRNTVCVSCMVGCPVNCKFCATGKMGFGGNLSAKEIIDQVMYFQRMLAKENQRVSNVVFMGMGEPMLNLPEVQKTIAILTDPKKLGLGQRRITVSTSGYIPQLKKLIDDGFRGRIAISLHAPNQELRQKMMPVAKLFSLDKLIATLDEYVELTNKRVTYEYIMIKNVNDTIDSARELVELFKDRLHHINLIPYNPIKEEDFERSPAENLREFTTILANGGINYTIRVTMGDDVNAACGQLADRENKRNVSKKIS